MRYALVATENKSKNTDSLYTYKVDSKTKLRLGDCVNIPFGTGNKLIKGYVFQLSEECKIEENKLKCIDSVDEDLSLNEEMIKTISWMKQRYGIKYIDGINCFVPKGKKAKEGKEKEPYKDSKGISKENIILTCHQKEATDIINSSIASEEGKIFLLHGVTSSGKTQVYIEAVKECLNEGKTAIMLVPEISLTDQLVEEFIGFFGKDKIAVLHSKLTGRQRYDEWQRIRNNKAPIVIGARMAAFAPLDKIGVIILDEEHEASYKSDMTPKYDTVEVAVKRAMYYKASIILGSATPSVQSYERCKEGIYQLITLNERYNKTPLPKVELVDMRIELREGNNSIFSRRLYHEMQRNLSCGKQVILLQNRRGYSNFISCRSCGHVIKCPICGISLTYHKDNMTGEEDLVCHYCGRKSQVPKKCPECDSRYIRHFGIGTEQVVDVVEEMFPDYTCDRLDVDSAKGISDIKKILSKFAKKRTDVLVGTQLVAKGLDFDNVGLVGIISADTTLNLSDYRANEKTFQLVTQVAGRSGRGNEQGMVVVQTYQPDSFVYRAALNHDYEGFFNEEIKIRKFMKYPPFSDIIMVNFTSEKEGISLRQAESFKDYMKIQISTMEKDRMPEEKGGQVLSPKPSWYFKGRDAQRYYIIVKCPKGMRNLYMQSITNYAKMLVDKKVDCNLNIDVNPYGMI